VQRAAQESGWAIQPQQVQDAFSRTTSQAISQRAEGAALCAEIPQRFFCGHFHSFHFVADHLLHLNRRTQQH
jgi:hypothetical protein